MPAPLRRHPHLYEINTWPWLARLSRRSGRQVTLASVPAAEWDAILLNTGVPAAQVLSVPEALQSDQVVHRALVSALPLPAAPGGVLRVLGHPTHIDGLPVAPQSPPPALGQHADEVLVELGYSPTEIARLREQNVI